MIRSGLRTLGTALMLTLAIGFVRADEVVLDGLSSKTPKAWKEEAPGNKMRLAQYRLPAAKDDKTDAELVIFKGLGGGAEKNIERWIGQFVPPEGKKSTDISKVTKIKIGEHDATMLDISGTYKFKSMPFNPNAKEELLPGYRMLAIYFEGPKDLYQVRVVGPAATVEKHKADFDSWIKSFK